MRLTGRTAGGGGGGGWQYEANTERSIAEASPRVWTRFVAKYQCMFAQSELYSYLLGSTFAVMTPIPLHSCRGR